MARPKRSPEVKRASGPSGPTVPEDRREKKQLLLRVLPAIADELRRRSRDSGLTVSAVVSALVMQTAGDDRSKADG
jgi:hypothetical protein